MFPSFRSARSNVSFLGGIRIQRGLAWGLIILVALAAFEIFNFSTTEYALMDVLGDLRFAGLRWATILAIAFCGIDFAGIARLFTPERGRDEPTEVWYLFSAWLLAAAMNATLTWWGVSMAIINHSTQTGIMVVSDSTLTRIVPIFVAVMVWVIRVLIIGTFSVAGERLFSQGDNVQSQEHPLLQPTSTASSSRSRPVPATSYRPAPKVARSEAGYAQPEPTYHNVALNAHSPQESEYKDSYRRS